MGRETTMARIALCSSFVLCSATAFIQPNTMTSGSTHAVPTSLLPTHRTMTAFNMFSGNSGDEKSAATTVDLNRQSTDTDKQTGTWNPFSLAVLKLGFTEPAYTSPLNYNKSPGTYVCANCRTPLFSSTTKYDSGSGWPSFWKTVSSNRVALKKEWDGRIECTCQNCGGHLGHVFPDGPTRGSLDKVELASVPDTDPKIGYKVKPAEGEDGESEYSRMPRFCVNGVALRFEEET